ncbi:MAG: B12-binding domain-containing radical SAM protein [Oligoflexia bacterium]|nr:B12-binding domain-containing radical SAM protein [Oligoflexia bacterium]
MKKREKFLLIYPALGMSGTFVRHVPIGLLYAAIGLVQKKYDVEIFDCRLYPQNWREILQSKLSEIAKNILAVGVSVMSGTPIKSAIEIGRMVKSIDPEIINIWGGPHATFFPESILENNWYCDIVVSKNAVSSFQQLATALLENSCYSNIPGIFYKHMTSKEIRSTPADCSTFEFYDYREIPYHLISDYSLYGQLDQKDKIIFPMYSALGCPYRCSFCSSPAEYNQIVGPKWVPLPVKEVVDHIAYVVRKYRANYIYFIDNDSFVDLKHVEAIMDEIERQGIRVKLGFRGARINEIKKMTHEFIEKLSRCGTDILHIGAESGSDRILDLIKKNCTVDDIIECNRKLAQHTKIIAAYNFIMGVPTETYEDLVATKDLMLKLIRENPQCLIFTPNKFRPLPGTELFSLVVNTWGYKSPQTLEEWVQVEAEGDYSDLWYTQKMKRYCDLLLIGSYFIDKKIFKVTSGGSLFYRLLRLIARIYYPIIFLRMYFSIDCFFIEHKMYKLIKELMPRFTSIKGNT